MARFQRAAVTIAKGLALCVLLFAAAPARSISVTVYADGETDFGFAPADVAAAIAAGAAEPTEVGPLSGGQGFFTITTPNRISGVKGKSAANPSRGTSSWTLHIDPETPAQLLASFSVVILGHDPNDPIGYKTKNVGLEIETTLPWMLVTPDGGDPTYVAFQLGDLAPGGEYTFPIEYRVAQKLKKRQGQFVFPRYAVAFVSLPEPSTLALLLAAALVGLAARRSR